MQPIIVLKDYKLFNSLGKGNFGEVFLTKKGNNEEYLATKRMDLKKINPIIKKYLNNEMKIMKQLNHPNIIHLVDLFQSTNHYYVIMEYCNGGTLTDCLKKYQKPFPFKIIQYIMRQIVNGLKYIHSKRIIHRDLKLDNILVNFKKAEDKNNLNLLSSEIKIIDFGLARILGPNELADTAAGSPINMDPCILKKYNKAGGYEKLQGYNEKADIWSLGTICYEMLTGKPLFTVESLNELQQKVEKGDYYLPTNINLSKEFISFMNGMLQYDWKNRLSADELSRHDFLVKNVNDFTPADLTAISSKIEGSKLIINAKENSTITNIFNVPPKKKGDPEWEAYINGLLMEYKAAKEYFRQNNLAKQEQNTNNIYLKIQNIKTQFDLGNYTYLKSLPYPITPEFIYGYSIEERSRKYNEVISKVINDKTQLETQLNSYDKNSIIFKNEKKLEYEQKLAELERCKENIKKVESTFNKIWSPAPDYIKETKDCNIEKVYNGNLLKFEIKKVDPKKDNINLSVELKCKDILIYNKIVKLTKENNYSDKWTWTITTRDWPNLDNFYLKIENDMNDVVKNKTYLKVNIGKVKGGKGITFNSVIPGENQENKEMINITLIPALLEGKKYLAKEKKEIFNIKIYSEFNGKSQATQKIPNYNFDF